MRGRLQASSERREKYKRQRQRVVGAELGDQSCSKGSLLLYLEILRWCLVCRPSNRQIQREEDGGQTAGAGDE